MPQCILRTAKLKTRGNLSGSAKHNFRERETPNADPTRTRTNHTIGPQTAAGVLEALEGRLKTVPTVRKNAVLAVEYFIGASPEFFRDSSRQQVDAFFSSAKKWLDQRHGAANVIAFTRHNDESTPHACAYVVPIDSRGRLNAAGWFDGGFKLSQMQTSFHEDVGKALGLERGVLGSKATHQDLKTYYGMIAAPTPEITVAVPELPEPTVMEQMKMMVAEKTGMKTDYHFAVEAQEKAKKKQNAQAEERRLALEAKARQYDADQKSREAREAELAELRETAQKMRAIPLEEVLEHFGANRSSKDKNTFETSVGRITIDKTKFLNHTLNKRGGGAIDLTMHMEDCDYQAAVARLARAFGLEQMAGDLAATAKLQVEQALEQQPEGVYRQPDAVPERWPQVREYLSKARSLSDDLVDMLHKQKLLFADKFSNACFVLGFNRERGTGNGVELHGTLGETPFHGVKGEKRTFILRQTSENEETRIALVESAIDAMSLRQLGFGGRILSLSGNTSLESYVSAAKERGIHLLAAFNADKAGDKLAAELKRLCPPGQMERLRPVKGRDWNEELKKTEVSSLAKPFDLASRLQHELKRQEKVRERGMGRD